MSKIPYNEFRTGLTFRDVREMLSHEQQVTREAGQYMFVSRSTVLGRWCQIKRSMYTEYERFTREREKSMRS